MPASLVSCRARLRHAATQLGLSEMRLRRAEADIGVLARRVRRIPPWVWIVLAILLIGPWLLAWYGRYLALIFGLRVLVDFLLPELA